jgi:hypothetical protein
MLVTQRRFISSILTLQEGKNMKASVVELLLFNREALERD